MQNLIKIENMNKEFPIGGKKFKALKEINLRIETGEFVGIVGPSGSGKTTLLNIIGSLDVNSSGSVSVLNNEIKTLSSFKAAKFRSHNIGFIFQTYNLLPVYTVYENVEFPLLLLKIKAKLRKKMIIEALEWVDLSDKIDSRPSQLSGGECQRVAIARAMVKKPLIVLADEPTANLDVENSHNILDAMKRINSELRTTFIFATHDQKVINYLNRKIVLVDGRITEDVLMKNYK